MLNCHREIFSSRLEKSWVYSGANHGFCGRLRLRLAFKGKLGRLVEILLVIFATSILWVYNPREKIKCRY